MRQHRRVIVAGVRTEFAELLPSPTWDNGRMNALKMLKT